MSLGARYVTPAAIAAAAAAAAAAGVTLQLYLLDSLEAINQRTLYKLSERDADDRVGELALKLIRRVPGNYWGPKGVARMSDTEKEPGFGATLREVQRAYESNPSFASECDAQVFRNLHPRLKRIGVKNKRHPIVEKLAEYILKELALKLHLLRTESYQAEFGWGSDMGVWQSMVGGKFPEFPAMATPPQFVRVAAPVPSPCRLRLENVRFRYAGDASPDFGIKDFSMEAAGISALLGPSGSYKTTLLKIIAGHLSQSAGKIFIGEDDVSRKPAEARRIATVFQGYALFPHLTAFENVIEGGRLRSEYSDEDRRWLAGVYLRRLGIEHCRDRLPAATSGGEQQRIAIARALMAEPRALLMDEPTAAIDGIQREGLAGILKQISEAAPELTILIVSHDRDFVFSVGASLTVVDRGAVVASGQLEELLACPPNLRTAEILQSHSIIRGMLRMDGRFTPESDDGGHLVVANPPTDLRGQKCVALVPHHAVDVSIPEVDNTDDSLIYGTVVDVSDNGGVVRLTIETVGAWRVTAIATKATTAAKFSPGSAVAVTIDPTLVHLVTY